MSELNWRGAEIMAKARAALPSALLAAAFVVEAHAKQKCPVDTGNLQGSIGPKGPSGDSIKVGTPVEYGVYQEFGTKYMPAQPYLRPAVDEHVPEIRKAFADVMRRAFT